MRVHSASERSVWYVFLMHDRVPNYHYPTPTFRTVSQPPFSETGLEEATVSFRWHHTNGVVKGGLREEESNDGTPGQSQDDYVSCTPHYRRHSRLPSEHRCLALSATRRQSRD